MAILTVGVDTAKNVFAVHGVNAANKVQLRQPKVARGKLTALVASLPPCTIGMEACTGAHYWAREFQTYGHTVRLTAPKLVTPYRMSGKRGNVRQRETSPSDFSYPLRHASEDAYDRSDRQPVNSANPAGRNRAEPRGANGVRLSGSYLGPHRRVQQGRL